MGKISGSNLIIKCLKAEGVETIFGIAGDHFLHLLVYLLILIHRYLYFQLKLKNFYNELFELLVNL